MLTFPTRYQKVRTGWDWLQAAKNTKGQIYVYHPGVDFNYGYGWDDHRQDVMSMYDGKVVYIDDSGYNAGWGKHIYIQHFITEKNETVYTHYAHLDSVDVTLDQWVNSGQVIGKLGTTGASTGPHLHFEIIKDWFYKKHMLMNKVFYPTIHAGFGTPESVAEGYHNPWIFINNTIPMWKAEQINAKLWAVGNGIAKNVDDEILSRPCSKMDIIVMLKRLEALSQNKTLT